MKPPTSRFGCLLGLPGAFLWSVLGHSSAYGGSCWAAVEAENVCHSRKRKLLETQRPESENIGNLEVAVDLLFPLECLVLIPVETVDDLTYQGSVISSDNGTNVKPVLMYVCIRVLADNQE